MNIAWISKIEWNMPHKTSRLKLSEALIKRGNSVNLYMVKKFGEKIFVPKNIICIPNIHIPILSGIFFGLIVFFYFPILLSKKNIDFIIIDATKVVLPFIMSLKILNIPLVLDIRTLPIDRDEPLSFKLSMLLSNKLIDGITTITPELKNTLIDTYKLKNKKFGIWSSGVSIKDFNNTKSNNEKNILNIENERKFTLIYHGDYSPTRGIENLIKAISKLDQNIRDDIKLLIIGMPDKIIKKLIKLSDDEGVKKQVIILPKVNYEKIKNYLKISDIGIIPLPPEIKWWRVSAPLKTLEYLAAKKPIIATNIPFHCKIFEKVNCGILIKSGSPESIALAIKKIYGKKNELKKMGENGRKIVEKYYTWDVMANKMEKFLKQLSN